MDGAGIKDQRAATAFLANEVRVPVADEVPAACVDCFAELHRIVAVKKGDSPAGQFEFAKETVARLPGVLDRSSERRSIVVAIAEHKMRRPSGEKRNDLRRADVAAVEHDSHFKAFEHLHGGPRPRQIAVRIADDA